jgi:hypothetical protein
MKIGPAEKKLTEMSVERERPDDWLRNAMALHRVWGVEVDEAARAVDSHWQAFERLTREFLGMSKPIEEMRGLDLFAAVFKDNPSALWRSLFANPAIQQQIDALGAEGHERIADKTSRAKKLSQKSLAKIPRTWRTMCVACWTDTVENWLPMPPVCLLSDTAILELWADDDDMIDTAAIRQEVHRLGLYRPVAPRFRAEISNRRRREGDNAMQGRVRFIQQRRA